MSTSDIVHDRNTARRRFRKLIKYPSSIDYFIEYLGSQTNMTIKCIIFELKKPDKTDFMLKCLASSAIEDDDAFPIMQNALEKVYLHSRCQRYLRDPELREYFILTIDISNPLIKDFVTELCNKKLLNTTLSRIIKDEDALSVLKQWT